MLTVTRSKARWPYMRYMVSSSGNSSIHGPHQVAQKSINRSLPVEFLRNAFSSSAETRFTLTGCASIFSNSSLVLASLYIHLVEHPTEGVFETSTGFPARRESMASRASLRVTRFSRGLLSTRPS